MEGACEANSAACVSPRSDFTTNEQTIKHTFGAGGVGAAAGSGICFGMTETYNVLYYTMTECYVLCYIVT